MMMHANMRALQSSGSLLPSSKAITRTISWSGGLTEVPYLSLNSNSARTITRRERSVRCIKSATGHRTVLDCPVESYKPMRIRNFELFQYMFYGIELYTRTTAALTGKSRIEFAPSPQFRQARR